MIYFFSYLQIIGIFILNEYHQKVQLPTKNAFPQETAVVSGWGFTSFPQIVRAKKLQQASMTILDNQECSNILTIRINDDQLCAFQSQGVGTCAADSGNPLVSNGVLIGIVLFGRPCATGVPDVYTRIFYVMDFIRSIVPK